MRGTVLLGVPVDDRAVAITRVPDGLLVEDDLGVLTWLARTPTVSRTHGRLIVAGVMPDGAARVTIRDDAGEEHEAVVGSGFWLVAGEAAGFSVPRVLYRDALGGVLVEDSVGWESEDEAWDDDDGSGVLGAIRIVFGASDEEEVDTDAWLREHAVVWHRHRAAELEGVAFPVHAARGLDADVTGWGGGRGDVSDITVTSTDQGEVTVLIVSQPLTRWDEDDDEGPAERLARRARDHAGTAAAVEAKEIVIDGEAERLHVLADGDRWLAECTHLGLRVTVIAEGVAPDALELAPLRDPTDPAAGIASEPTPELLARRDAAGGRLLDRAGVAALAESCGLGDHVEAVLGGVRAAYRLERGGDGRTRLGGEPDLAPGETWPHGEDGIPFTFVAQVDCSALPPLESELAGPPWGHGGRLVRIFAALDARVPAPGPAVALACPPDAPLTRTPVPPRPDPMLASAWEPDDDSLRDLTEVPVRLVPFLTTTPPHAVLPEAASRALVEQHREFAARLAGGHADFPLWRVSQLLGHAETVQTEDPRYAGPWLLPEVPEEADWRVLLNIADGHPGLSFGDGGALAIVVPVADLEAGRYDRLVTEASMG